MYSVFRNHCPFSQETIKFSQVFQGRFPFADINFPSNFTQFSNHINILSKTIIFNFYSNFFLKNIKVFFTFFKKFPEVQKFACEFVESIRRTENFHGIFHGKVLCIDSPLTVRKRLRRHFSSKQVQQNVCACCYVIYSVS